MTTATKNNSKRATSTKWGKKLKGEKRQNRSQQRFQSHIAKLQFYKNNKSFCLGENQHSKLNCTEWNEWIDGIERVEEAEIGSTGQIIIIFITYSHNKNVIETRIKRDRLRQQNINMKRNRAKKEIQKKNLDVKQLKKFC